MLSVSVEQPGIVCREFPFRAARVADSLPQCYSGNLEPCLNPGLPEAGRPTPRPALLRAALCRKGLGQSQEFTRGTENAGERFGVLKGLSPSFLMRTWVSLKPFYFWMLLC